MKHGIWGDSWNSFQATRHWTLSGLEFLKCVFLCVLLFKIQMHVNKSVGFSEMSWRVLCDISFFWNGVLFFETLLLIISCYSREHENSGWKQTSNSRRGVGAYLPVCSAIRKALTIMARSIFQCTEWANLQKEDKEKWVQFLPSEKVCLLERRIHSRFPGTFDLGLHRKL